MPAARLQEAQLNFDRAAAWSWDDSRVLSRAGEYFLQQNKYQEALNMLIAAAKKRSDPTLWFNIGLAYGGLDYWSESSKWLQQAVTLAPRNQTFKQALSQALYQEALQFCSL